MLFSHTSRTCTLNSFSKLGLIVGITGSGIGSGAGTNGNIFIKTYSALRQD